MKIQPFTGRRYAVIVEDSPVIRGFYVEDLSAGRRTLWDCDIDTYTELKTLCATDEEAFNKKCEEYDYED